jgi:hypothetical protein
VYSDGLSLHAFGKRNERKQSPEHTETTFKSPLLFT